MKKVAVIAICNFVDTPTGGEVTFLNSILKNKNEAGLEFYLIGMSNSEDEVVGQWQKKEISKNIYNYMPVFKEIKSKDKTKIPYRLRIIFGLIKYRKLIDAQKFDYIYIHCPEIVLGLGKKIIKNSKLIYHVHGEPSGTVKYSRFKLIQKISLISSIYQKVIDKAIQLSSKIIWVSERGLKEYSNISKLKNINEKSIVIANPFDKEIFTFDNKAKSDKELDLIRCVFVGRLSKGKNLELAIKAINLLPDLNLQFTICGDGEDRSRLENIVKDFNITDKVKFLGNVKRKDIAAILNDSDIFLMPSLNEGSPVCIPEALAMGNAVVSTNVGDVSSIVINNYNGFIINDFSVESYSKAIREIASLDLSKIKSNCIESSKARDSKVVLDKISSEILSID